MFRALNIPIAEPPFVKIVDFHIQFGNLQNMKEAVKRVSRFENSLEVSSKSDLEIGRKLSAFNLKAYSPSGTQSTVECFYQGSKVFEKGGPFQDLYWTDSRSAKTDKRLKNSGKLIGYQYGGRKFPLTPPGTFYCWLYMNSLRKINNAYESLRQYDGFTDVFYDPRKGNNCQAFACAMFVGMNDAGKGMFSVKEALSYMNYPYMENFLD